MPWNAGTLSPHKTRTSGRTLILALRELSEAGVRTDGPVAYQRFHALTPCAHAAIGCQVRENCPGTPSILVPIRHGTIKTLLLGNCYIAVYMYVSRPSGGSRPCRESPWRW